MLGALVMGLVIRTLVVVCTRWWKATDDRLIFANIVAAVFLGLWAGLQISPEVTVIWPRFWWAALCQIPWAAVDTWRTIKGLNAEPAVPGKPTRPSDSDA